MIVSLFLAIPVIFLCFFLLFIFSKDDFVLLRQNISLRDIFDLAAIAFLFAFICGRFFYIINDFNFQLLNLITFFHLLKFPGISSLGFFLGGAAAIAFLFRKKKGILRIYDIFSISFLSLFAFFTVGEYHFNLLILMGIIAASIIIFSFFVRSHSKYLLPDGSITLIFLFIICFSTFLSQTISSLGKNIILNLSFTQIVALPLIFLTVVLFITNKTNTK